MIGELRMKSRVLEGKWKGPEVVMGRGCQHSGLSFFSLYITLKFEENKGKVDARGTAVRGEGWGWRRGWSGGTVRLGKFWYGGRDFPPPDCHAVRGPCG